MYLSIAHCNLLGTYTGHVLLHSELSASSLPPSARTHARLRAPDPAGQVPSLRPLGSIDVPPCGACLSVRARRMVHRTDVPSHGGSGGGEAGVCRVPGAVGLDAP